MIVELEHKFSIKRVQKTNDDDYIKALRIYNDTTPYEIRTPTNELTYWIEKQNEATSFEVNAFTLYVNDQLIGLSITTFIKTSKIVVDEYLAVKEEFRIHTIFLAYQSLLQSYYRENNIELSYFLTEISFKNDGEEMDRESRISLKMMCIEEYGKINALYYALPIGMENHESSFIAHIYIKTVEPIKSVAQKTYQSIVESIYYDYSYAWYAPILPAEELSIFKAQIDKNFSLIKTSLMNGPSTMEVTNNSCNYLLNKSDISHKPIPSKPKSRIPIFIVFLPVLLITPLLIIWGYSEALQWLGISFSSVSTMVGAIISAMITGLVALLLSKRKS